MCLLDVVIAFEYGLVNSEVYMKILGGSEMLEACPRKAFDI